jgi:hypothetical protein
MYVIANYSVYLVIYDSKLFTYLSMRTFITFVLSNAIARSSPLSGIW